MRDYVSIGSSPCDEECAQVGTDNYVEQSKKECRAFANQLQRAFGDPPDGASIGVKSFDHDFGTYREVVCYFDDVYPDSIAYAFKLENEAPTNWDDKAREELGLATVTQATA
jgi:hypothetical protein